MVTKQTDAQSQLTDNGIGQIGLDEPWQWLAKGWNDIWQQPAISLGYGLAVTLISFVLTAGLFSLHSAALVLVLAAGFLLVGPLLAVGLYEKSRRLEDGIHLSFSAVAFVKTESPVQLGLMGVLLCLAFLMWVRLATLLFALFYGPQPVPPLSEFVPSLLFTWHGLGMLSVGTIVGGIIALSVFMLSAISVPLLMVEDMDAPSAAILSVKAVLKNPKPLLLWAWLIAILIACGIATGYVGLIVTFPLIGHGTWHAYRALRV